MGQSTMVPVECGSYRAYMFLLYECMDDILYTHHVYAHECICVYMQYARINIIYIRSVFVYDISLYTYVYLYACVDVYA